MENRIGCVEREVAGLEAGMKSMGHEIRDAKDSIKDLAGKVSQTNINVANLTTELNSTFPAMIKGVVSDHIIEYHGVPPKEMAKMLGTVIKSAGPLIAAVIGALLTAAGLRGDIPLP